MRPRQPLPYHSNFYHPELVKASNVVIGKVGYSTLAEIYNAGVAFGYIATSDFPESRVLVSFIRERMNGVSMEMDEETYSQSRWISRLDDLPSVSPASRPGPNGLGGNRGVCPESPVIPLSHVFSWPRQRDLSL